MRWLMQKSSTLKRQHVDALLFCSCFFRLRRHPNKFSEVASDACTCDRVQYRNAVAAAAAAAAAASAVYQYAMSTSPNSVNPGTISKLVQAL